MDSLLQDILFVWRSCRRQPGFALTALAMLWVGIGANTAASVPNLAAWQQRDIFTELSAYRGGPALGADHRRVRGMILWRGMRVAVVVGVAIGLVASYAVTRLVAELLFGVGTHDTAVFVAVPVVLTMVAFIAVWVPGRTACRVDPVEALRLE